MRAILFAFVMMCSAIASAITLDKIVVFGDSLSDNGNLYELYKHQFPMSPPYYQGRMTNGPVWVELLAQTLFDGKSASHLEDYAFSGASVEDEDDPKPEFTLKNQLFAYFLPRHDIADARTLYVVWIGANNYLEPPNDTEQATAAVNRSVKKNLEELAEKGAKHVLVLNLPDLGMTPAAREFGTRAPLSQLTRLHNDMLRQTVDNLKTTYPSVQWMHFDVESALDEMLTNPTANGFTNVTDACVGSNVESSRKSALSIVANVKAKVVFPEECAGYLFFDLVHPSALGHKILAARVRALLDTSDLHFVS
jgi:phospholipase/lecithinase/hemolysin